MRWLILIKCLSSIYWGSPHSVVVNGLDYNIILSSKFSCAITFHHVVPLARISLTLSRHFTLLFIASGRSSGLHPISSHSCCMYVSAGRPAFAQPYVGVHWSTSLMSSSLLLQQCPACLVHLTWIVFMMGGRWPYSWCLVGCCHQDLFNIARTPYPLSSSWLNNATTALVQGWNMDSTKSLKLPSGS